MEEAVSDTPPTQNLVGTDSGLQSIYRHRFTETMRRSKDGIWRVVVQDFLQRWVRAEDTVLDIGCGYGEFLNHVRCQRRIGIDLNPDSREALEAGIEFHSGDVRNLSFLDDESVDVAFTSNLMEHLPTKVDVETMVREARRVLRPGGHFIALGPNLRFLTGEYWDFWDHSTPITDRSLVELLENVELDVVDCMPKFLPYTTRSSLPQALWLVRAYLRIPLAWSILGKQFLIRARKS